MDIKLDVFKKNKYFWCSLFIFIGVLLLYFIFIPKDISQVNTERNFLVDMENKTFDLRQSMVSKWRKSNKDIVVVYIDDKTYEAVIEKYGSWPMPRYIYADIVDYIESQKPKIIAFDLMFVGNIKDKYNSDKRLGEVFKKYDNLYTAINFDNMDSSLRTPTSVNEKLSVNIDTKVPVNFSKFTNYRPIIKTITDESLNIGHVNTNRYSDGIIRSMTPFVEYQNKYYPHLALLVAQKVINSGSKNYLIDKNSNLKFDGHSYPMTVSGEIFLNWYGKNSDYMTEDSTDIESFSNFPMWRTIIATEQYKSGKQVSNDYKYDFKDKIVYIGTSTPNLNDIKATPLSKMTPGVETHTTFISNMLDNSFIHRLSFGCDFLITLILSLFIGFMMLKIEASKIYYKYMIPLNSAILVFSVVLYYLVSTYILMGIFNIWSALVMPTTGMVLTFTIIYIVKYFFKSQDYEYTYKLATTDGLTDLYNHRYFQEQMIVNIETSKRYGAKFSMILTDIDFFKKFNDKFGHQAGDAVLRQVAKVLKKNVRNIDLVCRYGGEEMSIILPNTDKDSAMIVAQKLCSAVSGTIFKLSSTIESNVTISLGVSTYPDDGETSTDLIEFADKGLYFAKENGRNQVGVVKNL